MKTIITRLYADASAARGVAAKLHRAFLPASSVRVVTARAGEDRSALETRLGGFGVHPDAAAAYAGRLDGGAAALVVHATYLPLEAPRITREIVGASDTLDAGEVTEEYKTRDTRDHAPSVMKSHPRFLTLAPSPDRPSGGTISETLGWRLLSPRRERHSAISGGRHVSRLFWPMPLISGRRRQASSAISGGRFMSRMFWPQPLLSRKERGSKVIPDGGHPLSRLMGWSTIARWR